MKKRYLLMLILLFLTIPSISAACICTMSQDPIFEGGTQTVVCVCSSNNERDQAYSLTWTDQLSAVLQTDLGITPSSVNVPFVESYSVPFGQGITNLTATLTGTNLEGSASSSVLTASNNTLILGDFVGGEGTSRIGELAHIAFTVKDSNNNTVTNAICASFLYSFDTDRPIAESQNNARSYGGDTTLSTPINDKDYKEDTVVKTTIACSCVDGTDRTCYNANGLKLGFAVGSTDGVFPIGAWFRNVTTVVAKNNYDLEDEVITVCANLTNPWDERISLDVVYNWRCGTSNDSTDRVVIDTYTERRAISPNLTQTQCADLRIVNVQSIANKANLCYAATEVSVIDFAGEVLYTYATTSDEFNFTSDSSIIDSSDVIYVNIEEVNMEAIILLTVFIIGLLIAWLGFYAKNIYLITLAALWFVMTGVTTFLLQGSVLGFPSWAQTIFFVGVGAVLGVNAWFYYDREKYKRDNK